MATHDEYTKVANALLGAIRGDITAQVPAMFAGMIPQHLAQDMAGQLAKIAVDTLDAYRGAKA